MEGHWRSGRRRRRRGRPLPRARGRGSKSRSRAGEEGVAGTTSASACQRQPQGSARLVPKQPGSLAPSFGTFAGIAVLATKRRHAIRWPILRSCPNEGQGGQVPDERAAMLPFYFFADRCGAPLHPPNRSTLQRRQGRPIPSSPPPHHSPFVIQGQPHFGLVGGSAVIGGGAGRGRRENEQK